MATTISIIFTGLCYLSNHSAGTEVNVVFPNASVPTVAETTHHGQKMIIPSHQVYVRYRLDQVVGADTTTKTEVVFRRLDLNNKEVLYGAYMLKGERVEAKVTPDGAQPLSFASSSVTPTFPPSKKDRFPFTMVVDIRKDASKSAGKLVSGHLNPTDGSVVRGRLDVKLGNLAATYINSKQVWRFKPDAEQPMKDYFLPQAVAWDIKSATDEIVFAFTPFVTNNPPAHTLKLKENGNPLDIEFGNAPIEDLVMSTAPHSPDHHFEVYYGLLDVRPPYLVVPHDRALSPEGANCPPAQGTP